MTTATETLTVHDVLLGMRLSSDPQETAIAIAMSAFKIVETNRIPTAGTDGIVMLFNPEFVASLSFDEIVGLITHELMHARLNHAKRYADSPWNHNDCKCRSSKSLCQKCIRRHRISNLAMDDEINPLVIAAGLSLPPDGCFPTDHDMVNGLSWESYYESRGDWLTAKEDENDKDDQPDESNDQDDSGDSDETTGSGSGASPDESNESDDNSDDEGDESSGTTSGDAEDDADGSGSGDSGDDSDDIGSGVHSTGELAKEFAPELIKDVDVNELAEQLSLATKDRTKKTKFDKQAKAHESKAGSGQSLSGSASADLVGSADPVLIKVANGQRWQDAVIDTLRRSPESRTDWSRRSRRMQPGSKSYIPGRKKVNGVAVALVIDVSGSCVSWFSLWQELVNELVDEVPQIVRIELVYHNHSHIRTETWHAGEGEVRLNCRGGGGTCHREALAEVETLDVDSIIQFTDNETTWPEHHPDLDCVTVMPPGSYELCPFGVNVEAEVR